MLFTLGYATHTPESLIHTLALHDITAVADVRGVPYSRHAPIFNRETLRETLRRHDLAYVWLGDLLGGPREDDDRGDDFAAIARSEGFARGLDRLRDGISRYRICLLCAEIDPLACHRFLLISRALRDEIPITHLNRQGLPETQEELETRLLRSQDLPDEDLFRDRAALIELAYARAGERRLARR